MTYDQFWNGPPSLVKAYRKAEEFRARRVNVESWRMGMYTVAALHASVGNMFQKKGSEPIRYPDQPFPLTQEEADKREAERAEQFEERLKADMMRWVAASQKQKEGGDHSR